MLDPLSVGPSDLGETGHSAPGLVGDVVCADLRVLECLAVHGKVGELISLKHSKFDTKLAQNHKNIQILPRTPTAF